MVTGADDPLFVDTNILAFATLLESPWHQAAQAALQHWRAAGSELWISRQILREYIAALTRPQTFAQPRPVLSVIADVQYFQTRFRIAEDGPDVTDRHLMLLQQIPMGGKQVHDANIVATMLAHGIPRLLTHNTADFTRFAGHITVIAL